MAFYDSSSDREVGFPIILEPDDDSLFEVRTDDTRLDNDTMKEVHKVKEVKRVKEVAKNAMAPKHPIISMQGAFAESMEEASDTTRTEPKLEDAATRRKILIEQDVTEDTHSLRWQRKPGQKHHELWKLMAQISFGIYLLLNGIAKDEEQVMSILQGHVNEVDGFLEMTLEDFDLAQTDIEERLKHLKLPLQNIAIFDAMLEDEAFRAQIVSGNERIEHVITRTAAAMKDSLLDAQQGMDACKEFTIYLAEQKDNAIWRQQQPHMERVFDAMCGNVEGWHQAYVSLQTKGNHLGVALGQLGSIVAEMDRRAGRISQDSRFSSSSPVQAQASPVSRNLPASMVKELPGDPNPITPAIAAPLPSIALVPDRERTPEPDSGSESEPESPSEVETEPLYTLQPITYSPMLLPTTYSPTLAPTTYSPGLAPTINSSILAPTTHSSLLQPATYSPFPSPKPSQNSSPDSSPRTSPESSPIKEAPQNSFLQPAPVGKRTSIRKRFSLKRKETDPDHLGDERYREERSREPNREERRNRDERSADLKEEEPNYGERMGSGPLSIPRRPELAMNTPPSRGIDSAYCSESDPPVAMRSLLDVFPSPSVQPPSSATSAPILESHERDITLPALTRDFIPSPHSEKQFFRPVNASPHSPLQRPWTAAPMNHHHEHVPSSLGRSMAPSRMGMSVMSDISTVTMEDGKKVKKKRSAFGWIKKAFSLSEEERMEYEARRRRQEPDPYYERPPRQFLDGKRLPQPPPSPYREY
ncbi:hypothetical protein NHQ30_002720 [Ciborinia camelliae]|nr:hypothetical protein NHQ30_002720 [Ciborinia camelliae]